MPLFSLSYCCRQQMPMFADIRYITFTRQTWLQNRFPCHVGLLAELCSNPEASYLQQTLTIVWDHLRFTRGFRASSWPPHTFSRGLCTLRQRAQVSACRRQLQPGLGLTRLWDWGKEEKGKDRGPEKHENSQTWHSSKQATRFQGQGTGTSFTQSLFHFGSTFSTQKRMSTQTAFPEPQLHAPCQVNCSAYIT